LDYFLGTSPVMGLARTSSLIRNPLYPPDTPERRGPEKLRGKGSHYAD